MKFYTLICSTIWISRDVAPFPFSAVSLEHSGIVGNPCDFSGDRQNSWESVRNPEDSSTHSCSHLPAVGGVPFVTCSLTRTDVWSWLVLTASPSHHGASQKIGEDLPSIGEWCLLVLMASLSPCSVCSKNWRLARRSLGKIHKDSAVMQRIQ